MSWVVWVPSTRALINRNGALASSIKPWPLRISWETGATKGYALANLGMTYSLLGSPVKAIDFLNESLQIAMAIDDPKLTQFAKGRLARLQSSPVISE